MTKTQMNTRIDARVKAAGDSAFAAIGWLPSQVVQTVWHMAAIDGSFPRRLQAEAAGLGVDTPSAEEQPRDLEARRGANLVAELCELYGLSQPLKDEEAGDTEVDYRQLREDALAERWKERGLL